MLLYTTDLPLNETQNMRRPDVLLCLLSTYGCKIINFDLQIANKIILKIATF